MDRECQVREVEEGGTWTGLGQKERYLRGDLALHVVRVAIISTSRVDQSDYLPSCNHSEGRAVGLEGGNGGSQLLLI